MQRLAVNRRLELRLLQGHDAPLLAAVVAAHRDHLRRWLPWAEVSTTVADSLAFIEAALDRHGRREAWEAGVWSDGMLVGMAGYNELDWAHGRGVLGYWLVADEQGRGTMTRCCGALLDHGFSAWGLQRAEIRCAPANERSRAVALRLGFAAAGRLSQAEWLQDRYEDHEVYGLLATQWQARRPARPHP